MIKIQQQRSDLDIPLSVEDAHEDAWVEIEIEQVYWEHYYYWNPWAEDVMPEWTWGLGLNPKTYWHPWAECPSRVGLDTLRLVRSTGSSGRQSEIS